VKQSLLIALSLILASGCQNDRIYQDLKKCTSGKSELQEKSGKLKATIKKLKKEAKKLRADYTCASHLKCKKEGLCNYQLSPQGFSSCIAKRQKDCLQSLGCIDNGKCVLDSQARKCVASSSNWCRESKECENNGHCHATFLNTVKRWRCLPSSEKHCAESIRCIQFGHCTYGDFGYKCNSDFLDFCPEVKKYCVPGSTSQCRQSFVCADNGLCTYKGGKCVATRQACLKSNGCWGLGKCTPKQGKCVIASTADCQRSVNCRVEGYCTFDKNRKDCIVGSDSNCSRSENCSAQGHCFAKNGMCVKKT